MKENTVNTKHLPVHNFTRIPGIAIAVVALLSAAGTAGAGGFEYSGDTGPGFWGETSGWEACSGTADTTRQSPININKRVTVDESLAPLELESLSTDIHLINNGHVIEQEYENGSVLIYNNVVYNLLQFHFHTQSEHAVKGTRGLMELHAVFRDEHSGNLAVIGQIYKKGRRNEFLQSLIDAELPRKSGDVSEEHTEIDVADAFVDTSSYATYDGSLTTPPCSEIVTWIVLREMGSVSRSQFRAFNDIMGNNFRPLQKRAGRRIFVTQGAD